MTSRLATICLLTMILTGVSSSPLHAQEGEAPRTALKGVTAVYVVVEELSDSAKSLGLTAESIRTDVALKLVTAGMNVVTREEGQKLPGRPFLYIRITVTNSQEAAYVAVELDQDVQLERNNQRALSVTTWDTGTISAHPTGQIIREVVKDDVDEFLKAWLAANPKK